MPPKGDMSRGARRWDCQQYFFEQRAQQLFSIPIRRGRRRPDGAEILAKVEQPAPLGCSEDTTLAALALLELCFSGLQLL